MCKPTKQTYDSLTQAYDHFNATLFAGALPGCLITLVRKKKIKGYFWQEKFQHKDSGETSDEIALNPDLFKSRTLAETLSTLVHEMCHLQQHHFGKPSRSGYHNREWADMMLNVGLVPTTTGDDTGKQTGQRVTHFIQEGGFYEQAFSKLEESKFALPWENVDAPGDEAKAKKKAASKTKYTCPDCEMNAWAKPDTNLICGDCHIPLEM